MEAHGLLAAESLSSLQSAFSSSDRLIGVWGGGDNDLDVFLENGISLKEKLLDLYKMCSVRD